MARSRISTTSDDLISDGGSVLWSMVVGEQLEFPITLNFMDGVEGYTFEAVVLEAENAAEQTARPSAVLAGGAQTTLTTRVPALLGTWSGAAAYDQGDLVLYESAYYILTSGSNRVSATTPDTDVLWEETVLNKMYVQFPSSLGSDWGVDATVNSPVYGFFELRVTEPSGVLYQRTWKPVRGLVELLYSPTDVV